MALEPSQKKRSTDQHHRAHLLANARTLTMLLRAVSLVAGLAIVTSSCSKPSPQANDPKTSEFQEAMKAAKDAIGKEDFQSAYDLILAASLLQPSDGELFGTVLDFIQKAAASADGEANLLAEDLLSRGEGLIPYQPISSIQNARKRFQETARQVSDTTAMSPPALSDPFEPIKKLIGHANNQQLPLDVRTRACEMARNAIADRKFSLSIAQDAPPGEESLKQLTELEDDIDNAEQEFIALEFQPIGQKWAAWLHATKTVMDEIRSWKDGKRDQSKVEQLRQQIQSGNKLFVELSPYSKLGVPSADEKLREVDSLLGEAQRAINWAYNVEVRALVRDLENSKTASLDRKIRSLALVKEEELSPEVLRLHNALWDKVYEQLKGEDEKVAAIRMRILRTDK